jgi:hypothetical protein
MNSVETVEIVIVVVGSSLAEVDVIDSGPTDVALAGSTDVASLVAVADVSAVRVLELGKEDSVTDDARVSAAAAPVSVVKPAVAPVKVADIVTNTIDPALVG